MQAELTLPIPAERPSFDKLLGFGALGVTLLIWAAFFLSLRAGAKSHLAPEELALVRFGPAGLVFLPVLVSRWRRILAVPPLTLLSIFAGAGLPYFLVAGMGMRHAPVADGSTMIPGTLPLFISLIGLLGYRQRLSRGRMVALAMITLGVLGLVWLRPSESHLGQGYALFLLGSAMWSNFTLGLRRSGLTAVEGAAVISTTSLVCLLGWMLFHPPVGLLQLPISALLFHGAVQGVGVGLASTLCYAFAISKLGPERAGTAGALTPVLASLMAVPLFGEVPGTVSVVAMLLIVTGVILANRPASAR